MSADDDLAAAAARVRASQPVQDDDDFVDRFSRMAQALAGPREVERMTVAGFLLARYAEDEATAQDAATIDHGTSRPSEYRPEWCVVEDYDMDGGLTIWAFDDAAEAADRLALEVDGVVRDETGETRHIMAHDPARVLAEVEAKRRIVERETAVDRPKIGAPPYNGPLNDPDSDEPRRHPKLQAYLDQWGEQVTDTPILRLLALPHAGHPDYQQEWKP